MNGNSYVSVIFLFLKIPEIFHLVVWGNGLVRATETMERKLQIKGNCCPSSVTLASSHHLSEP